VTSFEDVVRAQRVIGIVRTTTAPDALTAIVTLVNAGLQAVEVSLVTPDALQVIREARQRFAGQAYIGVGTVLHRDEARAAALAGAQFVVAPTFNPEVVAACRESGLPVVPGVTTPTEAVAAHESGATFVKLFPASVWSPRSVRDLLAALPSLPLVPTGGIGLQDAPVWIEAGAVAVGIGGALTRGDAVDASSRITALLAALAVA
jgi:2-dehydro-3-deoxyphosphogluconate aldolase / (4S)-4-hydroxy-2-oxoglutarate aldolase